MKLGPAFAMALLCCVSDAQALERWGPTWSELSGARYYRARMNREPAIIKSVDGRSYLNRVVKIAPGKHDIVVQSPSRRGWRGSDRSMSVDIAPCQRYYINAQFVSGVGPDCDPVVAKVENIGGCWKGGRP